MTPNVFVVFTDQGGPIVNQMLDLKWTHVLVRFDGPDPLLGLFTQSTYYEATWPVVRKTDSFKSVDHLVVPVPAPVYCDKLMRQYAESKLGTRYNFWGYFFPRWYGKTHGIYCSQFACDVLRAGGLPIPKGAGWSPDKLLKALKVYL